MRLWLMKPFAYAFGCWSSHCVARISSPCIQWCWRGSQSSVTWAQCLFFGCYCVAARKAAAWGATYLTLGPAWATAVLRRLEQSSERVCSESPLNLSSEVARLFCYRLPCVVLVACLCFFVNILCTMPLQSGVFARPTLLRLNWIKLCFDWDTLFDYWHCHKSRHENHETQSKHTYSKHRFVVCTALIVGIHSR